MEVYVAGDLAPGVAKAAGDDLERDPMLSQERDMGMPERVRRKRTSDGSGAILPEIFKIRRVFDIAPVVSWKE